MNNHQTSHVRSNHDLIGPLYLSHYPKAFVVEPHEYHEGLGESDLTLAISNFARILQ